MQQSTERNSQSFRDLLLQRRIVLCAGSGGVGKTTTTAALGLLGASLGLRTLCLTIDPARRLAESLGLERADLHAQHVSADLLASSGFDIRGSLTVMMLDTRDTFDGVVRRYASSQEARERILNNKLYQYVSTSLAGTQEYMAMEKLYEVASDSQYDLIILDTPPTSHALDFLDAPRRLIDAVDGSATRWILKAFRAGSGLSFDLLAKPAAMALRGMSRFTGKGFLEEVGAFLSDIHELFGGFSERAHKVQQVLHGPDIAYVLVSSASPTSLAEVLLFADRLHSIQVPVEAVVVNRYHPAPPPLPSQGVLAQALQRRGIDLGEDGLERLAQVVRDERLVHELDDSHVQQMLSQWRYGREPLWAYVPAISHDVHDVVTLGQVARFLEQTMGSSDSNAPSV